MSELPHPPIYAKKPDKRPRQIDHAAKPKVYERANVAKHALTGIQKKPEPGDGR